jgi:PAS domain S-box-containing protein
MAATVEGRRKAHAELSQAVHKLKVVLNNLPAAVGYVGRDARYQLANTQYQTMLSIPSAELIGKTVQEGLGETIHEQVKDEIACALGGTRVRFERHIMCNGLPMHALIDYIPDLELNQPLQGYLEVIQDVTALRTAQTQQAINEQRLQQMIGAVHNYALYLLDTRGHVVSWNANASINKGFRDNDVIGKHFSLFFLPEDIHQGKPERELVTAARAGRFEAECWLRDSAGNRYWAQVVVSAVFDGQGQLTGYTKIVRDLTANARQHELLLRVVEQAPTAMLMADGDGRIVLVNAQVEAMFGWSRLELLGQSLEVLMPQRFRAAHPSLRAGFMKSRSARAMGPGRNLYALRKNGEQFPVEIGLTPIDTRDGPATLAAISDITERHRHQAATEQALAEKETLLKEVYHRVKNNLQVIQSLLTLQRRSLPEGLARSAIDNSVQRVRAMALVHEKLYQAGNLSAVSLPDYTKDLLKQVAEANGAYQRGIVLHADVDQLETGLDSAIPFGLLLTELITNCLKHGFPDQRRGEVWVKLRHEPGGDLLTVADNGVGLPPNFDSAQSKSMGLELAASLAKQLGGKLSMASQDGAVFSALLTRLSVREPAA